MDLQRIRNRARRLVFGRNVEVWHDAAFRLPLTALEGSTGFEPRRADLAMWFLADAWAIDRRMLRRPRRVRYRELARVHTPEFLESLAQPSTLARIFAVDESDMPADEVLNTIRLACGATVQAARSRFRRGGTALNLFGGFHHASPDQAGGFCAVNDIAVAIAELRQLGCSGQVVVLDTDAHPPDGLAACLAKDPLVWIGSLSSVNWGALEGVDETVLERGTDDRTYVQALDGLLARMPKPRFAFVIAGGDVLAGDRLGKLGLTLEGTRQRDLRIRAALGRTPSVWMPGGGYAHRSWRVLAGTGLALTCRSGDAIPEDYDPMRARFGWLASKLTREQLEGDMEINATELEEALGLRAPKDQRLLGFYTREGIKYALSHYGILPHIRRLGYERLEVSIDKVALGEVVRLHGDAGGQRYMLFESVLERRRVFDKNVLYVHWMTLRDPKARFSGHRPQLPGQDAPGLGLAQEIGWALARIARRLCLDGVAYRPAWFHTAYSGRYHFEFVDAARQGRFDAAMRDLRDTPLLEVTHAAADGRLRMNGEPYTWEADEMVFWLGPSPLDERAVRLERERVRFAIADDSSDGVHERDVIRTQTHE
jgi:acetoin utilization deacetylase AcuC-like enzyme